MGNEYHFDRIEVDYFDRDGDGWLLFIVNIGAYFSVMFMFGQIKRKHFIKRESLYVFAVCTVPTKVHH